MHWHSCVSIGTWNLKCPASPIPKIWLGQIKKCCVARSESLMSNNAVSPGQTVGCLICSDGTIHRIVSNITILKAYRIVLNIAIIPSQTIRYFAVLYYARCPYIIGCAIGVIDKENDGRGVISVTRTFQGRRMHSTEAAGRTHCQ